MRLPIQLALAWPERLPTGVASLPLTESALTFEPVDREAFPALDLAYRVGGLGLTFPAVMNAANEVAVMAFLEGKIPLTRIVEIVQTLVDEHEPGPRWSRSCTSSGPTHGPAGGRPRSSRSASPAMASTLAIVAFFVGLLDRHPRSTRLGHYAGARVSGSRSRSTSSASARGSGRRGAARSSTA